MSDTPPKEFSSRENASCSASAEVSSDLLLSDLSYCLLSEQTPQNTNTKSIKTPLLNTDTLLDEPTKKILKDLKLGSLLRTLQMDARPTCEDLLPSVGKKLQKDWKDFWSNFVKNEVKPLHELEKHCKIPMQEKHLVSVDWEKAISTFEKKDFFVEAKAFAQTEVSLKEIPKIPPEVEPSQEKWHKTLHPVFRNRNTDRDGETPKVVTTSYIRKLDNEHGVKGLCDDTVAKTTCPHCKRKGHTVQLCPFLPEKAECVSDKVTKFRDWIMQQPLPKLSHFVGSETESILRLPFRLKAWQSRVNRLQKKWMEDTSLSPEIFEEKDFSFYPQSRRNHESLWYWCTMEGVNHAFLVDLIQGFRTRWIDPKGPPLLHFRNTRSVKENREFFKTEIPRLVKAGILVPVPKDYVKYVHPVHVVTEPKLRTIVDGGPQNHFCPKHSVRMLTGNETLMSVEYGYWSLSWDTRDAFYSTHVHPTEALYNCIAFEHDNAPTEYYALLGRPMGRSDSPWDYCRGQFLLKKMLCSWGMRVEVYMDDQFVQVPPHHFLFSIVKNTVVTVLNRLSILCKKEKTFMKPEQTVWDFMGMCIDSQKLTVRSTEKNEKKTRNKLDFLLTESKVTVRHVHAMHGKLVSLRHSIQHVQVLTLALKDFIKSLYDRFGQEDSNRWEEMVELPKQVKTELEFIRANLHWLNESPVWNSHWHYDVFVDASDSAIGIHNSKILQKVEFATELAQTGSLLREAIGILFAMANGLHMYANKRVRFFTDNLGLAVCWQRNSSKLPAIAAVFRLTKAIALRYGISFWVRWNRRCQYGAVLADRLSKAADVQEWSINPTLLQSVLNAFGLPQPTIDAFAAKHCGVAPEYASQLWDGMSSLTNAVSDYSLRDFEWNRHFVYANPPFDDRVVSAWLEIVFARKMPCLVVLPVWSGRTWWWKAQQRAELIVEVPRKSTNFIPPKKWTRKTMTPKWDFLFLFFNVSGVKQKMWKFNHFTGKVHPKR